MNLGQAVAVCLYELASRAVAQGSKPVENAATPAGFRDTEEHPPGAKAQRGSSGHDARAEALAYLADRAASSGNLDRLAETIEEAMLAADYSPAAMREANRHDLRLLLRRLTLTEADARRVLGLFRRILWRLRADHDHSGTPGKPK